MTAPALDLGDLENLAVALGLLERDAGGGTGFRDDWLTAPGRYLSSVLATDAQREALVAVVDDLLGGATREMVDGVVWLPIVASTAPVLTLYLVLDARPEDHVRVGLGVAAATTEPVARTRAHAMLFRAARKRATGQWFTGVDPILLGQPGGTIGVSTEIVLRETAPPRGEASLGRVAFSAEVPTSGAGSPRVSLTLGQLQMPGGSAPRDLRLAADETSGVDRAALDLVLGLVQAQAAALAGTPIAALAGLLGLREGAGVPALPVADLPSQGARALGAWFEGVVAQVESRRAWLGQLAALIGADHDGDQVTLAIGLARLSLSLRVATGAGGRPVVTPALAVSIGEPDVRVRAEAELARLDLGSGAAVALPSLALFAQAGRAEGPLLTGDPAVEALRVGLALDAARRPVFLLAADGVTIGGRRYPTLDLSSPGAVAETLTTVLSAVVDALLARLAPADVAIRALLGIPGAGAAPGTPAVDLARFLQDPLTAVREYWRRMLEPAHRTSVVALLESVRTLLAAAGVPADRARVRGAGTAEDPWRLGLAGPLDLVASTNPAADRLDVALAAITRVPALGGAPVTIESALTVGLATVDLTGGAASFATSAGLQIAARPSDGGRALVDLGPVTLSSEEVGLAATWRPSGGLHVALVAPGLSARDGDLDVPLTLPVVGPDGRVTLDATGWASVETLIGLLAMGTRLHWVDDLVRALGWTPRLDGLPAGERPRLRLADLAVSPAGALTGWLGALALSEAGEVQDALQVLASWLTGTGESLGFLAGTGAPDDPYRLPLSGEGTAPALAVWLLPAGPGATAHVLAPDALRAWRPGDEPLSTSLLAAALAAEAGLDRALAGLLEGRAEIEMALEELIGRWTGTDGRILPPAANPVGISVHRFPDVAWTQLAGAAPLDDLLPSVPPTVVRVVVRAADAPLPEAPAGRVVDLRAPGLAPEAFTPPGAAPGEWVVVLPERPAAPPPARAGTTDAIAGQAARLARILAPFLASGAPIGVVAEGGAGHAARRALDDLGGTVTLVTLGTPQRVAFSILDDVAAADALMLLRALLPPVDPDETDDLDLATARGLVAGLADLLTLDDPAAELAAPPVLPGAPRPGLTVHEVYGVVGEQATRRAVTAVIAAGLAARARARFDPDAFTGVTGLRAGAYLPLALESGPGDLAVHGHALLELCGVTPDAGGGAPMVSTRRAVTVHVRLRRADGRWLVGGPGVRTPEGRRPPHELRWAEATVTVPIDAGVSPAGGAAELVLHDARVFGLRRDRVVVRADGGASALDAVVHPALAEVRTLLSHVGALLAGQEAGTPGALLRELLGALGVADGEGRLVPDAVARLLHEPARQVADALAVATRRTRLEAALRAVFGPGRGVGLDLSARRVTLTAATSPGETLLAWTLTLELDPAGFHAEARVGAADAPEGGLELRLTAAPLTAALEWRGPGSAPQVMPLWPDPDGDALLALLPRLVPAELLRLVLEALRGASGTARAALDAALDAVGLLRAATADGARAVRFPAALVADPGGWLGHALDLATGGAAGQRHVAALLDGLKPLVGVAGPPGQWELTPGFTAFADTAASGALRIGVRLDTTSFTPPAGGEPRLVAAATLALAVPAGAPPEPDVALEVGVATGGTRRAVRLAVGADVSVALVPSSGPEIPLYPDPPGLAQLAGAGVSQALPLVLDALGRQTGTGLPARAGAVVAAVGEALGLRSGGAFDGTRLAAWASDPAGQLSVRLRALQATDLAPLVTALNSLIPDSLRPAVGLAVVGAPAAEAVVEVRVGAAGARTVVLTLRPNPIQVRVAATVTGLPAEVGRVSAAVSLDATGLGELELGVGPGAVEAGAVRLRPYAEVVVGQAPPSGRRVEVGLIGGGVGAVGARWRLDGSGVALLARRFDPATATFEDAPSDPGALALALLDVVLGIAAGVALDAAPVRALLRQQLPGGGAPARRALGALLTNVVLAPASPGGDTPADRPRLVPGLFDAHGDVVLARVRQLVSNLAAAQPSVPLTNGLRIGVGQPSGRTIVQLTLSFDGRVALTEGDVRVSLEADSRWIAVDPRPAAGLAIDLLDVGGGALAFAPGLAANGIGVRIARANGPLLDAALTLGSVALHLYGEVRPGTLSGGVQLQLGDLAVTPGAATGGGNAVARGLVADAGQRSERLAPAFSPALAVQKIGDGPVLVSLRAGEGDGPWWLAIQRGFGPIYVEQVGFGVTVRQDQLESISLLLDGRVSLFGLTAAVDDLRLTFVVADTPPRSVFDPARWAVDLGGIAVDSNVAGVSLAGGLRKFAVTGGVEYVGMLVARVATYGLSVYGGYGTGRDAAGHEFAAFFAFGALNGPIGGPPAFFVTGIGGGFGINRALVVPQDFATFGTFPLLRALDPGARPAGDPMGELSRMRESFPMARGQFWFAAGISFTSFALVDGVAVLSVAIGDELEVALLGLARMALPRPGAALVSIELGLLARLSTREGVLWVQAQLTDNSWLLHESVRLTGGFAFVTWFAGQNRGQFVLTLGGYHPSFHKDGYPVVPRLGFRWQLGSAIVIKGESYFALTSEAVMAGGRLEASARFGPAWAHVVLGADGIVYFDPFRFEVEVYASIAAGVTIDLWLGEVTISISLGARVQLSGPRFHGRARFDIGPISLTVEFGDPGQTEAVYLSWDAFAAKYLEEARPGVARVLSSAVGRGMLPPGPVPAGETNATPADGSAARPYSVLSEFDVTIVTTVPTVAVTRAGWPDAARMPSSTLGLAPMGVAADATSATRRVTVEPRIAVRIIQLDSGADRARDLSAIVAEGAFPLGVWGPPQDEHDRKVPAGDVISALDRVRLESSAVVSGTLAPSVRYQRVETNGRKPLPFAHEAQVRAALLTDASAVAATLPAAGSDAAVFAAAGPWLARGGYGATALAALAGDRAAPPRLGSLTEGLAAAPPPLPGITLVPPVTRPPVDARVLPPRAVALLSGPSRPERPTRRTTVAAADKAGAARTAVPDLTRLLAQIDPAIPMQLLRPTPRGTGTKKTVIPTGAVPLTRAVGDRTAAVDRRGAVAAGRRELETFTAGVTARTSHARRTEKLAAPATLRAGQIAVLQLPNAARDVDPATPRPGLAGSGAPARAVVLGAGGGVLADALLDDEGIEIPRGAERIAVLALGDALAGSPGLPGWQAGDALPYVGWSVALAPGALVRAEGARVPTHRQRSRGGWVSGAELVAGTTLVTTQFAEPVTSVVVILDDPGALDGDGGRGLALGLDGAERAAGRDGQPLPPAVVVAGNRSCLVYAVAPSPDKEPVRVSIASEERWHLAGVLGARAPVASLVERLARCGLESLVRPLVAGGGTIALRWVEPKRAPAARTPATGAARKRAKGGTEKATKRGARKRSRGRRDEDEA